LPYLTFIRPYLEFVDPVWSSFLKGDIDMIEQTQKRAIKIILAIRNLNYENKCRKLKTLKDRRLRRNLIQKLTNVTDIIVFKLY
jgi:hypothetical protein